MTDITPQQDISLDRKHATSGSLSNADSTLAPEDDPNGARTAVGVPHPENRLPHDPNFEGHHIEVPELDDYDDNKNLADNPETPLDRDEGRSFFGLTDAAEEAASVVDGDDNDEADTLQRLTPGGY